MDINFFFCLFRAYESSQARGPIGAAAAAGLHHSHRNTGSFNPLSKSRDQTHILTDTTQILNPLCYYGNSYKVFEDKDRSEFTPLSPTTSNRVFVALKQRAIC